MQINKPEVLTEVTERFLQYEKAGDPNPSGAS
jgi:hypothetical protein